MAAGPARLAVWKRKKERARGKIDERVGRVAAGLFEGGFCSIDGTKSEKSPVLLVSGDRLNFCFGQCSLARLKICDISSAES